MSKTLNVSISPHIRARETTASIMADVIIALYSADGSLVGIDKQTALLKSGAKTPFTFSFTDAENAEDVKLFVWKHGEMTPLCAPCIPEEE